MSRVLITGTSGMDGSLLSRMLLDRQHEVYGTIRRVSSPTNLWRLADLQVLHRVHLIPADVTDFGSLLNVLSVARPEYVVHLAAQSFVKASFEMPNATVQVDALGTLNLLEAVRALCPSAKVYIACSSEMWGLNRQTINDETAVLMPASPYGLSKLFSHHLARIYRQAYGLFVVSGVLSNHDSQWRGLEFVSRKISNYVGRLSAGSATQKLRLGNIKAVRDFGYAPSFVEAIWAMLQRDVPEDFVIATGRGHSVEEFAAKAFALIGRNWEDYIEISPDEMRPLDIGCLVGDPRKAHEKLGWANPITFNELIEIMVQTDIERWRRHKRGEVFAWDVVPERKH